MASMAGAGSSAAQPQLAENFSDQDSMADDCSDQDDEDDGREEDDADTSSLKRGKTRTVTGVETTSVSGAPVKGKQDEHLGNHVGFTCNSCYGAILGFRYSCVECVDFDLCARCEAMKEHDHHYVLRVPGPRPEAEFKGMMADIRAALNNRSENSENEVEVKYEPGSDDEDMKPVDPLNVPSEGTEPDGSGPGQDLLSVLAGPTGDPQGQPAQLIAARVQEILVLPVPSATHTMVAPPRQPTMIIKPLVPKTVRTQTQSSTQTQRKVTAAAGKRKSTSAKAERLMVPAPFKMPKEEPLDADSGDTGNPTTSVGHASEDVKFKVFTMQHRRDDDEEFDSGVS